MIIPHATFYITVLINLENLNFRDSMEFAIELIRQKNVKVIPGELFYGKGFIRLVSCCDEEVIKELGKRILEFCNINKKR